MPFCIHCGSPVETGERFCPSCGALLEQGGDTTRHQPPSLPGSPHRAKADMPFAEEEIMPLRPRGPFALSAGKIAVGVLVLLIIAAGAYVILSGSLPVAGKTAPAAGSAGISGSEAILPVNGQCSAGLSLCRGTCVDLRTDTDNCGACGFAVPVDQICQERGVCLPLGNSNNPSPAITNGKPHTATLQRAVPFRPEPLQREMCRPPCG